MFIWKKDTKVIKRNPLAVQPLIEQFRKCDFYLPVFAEIGTKTNNLKNDFSTWVAFFSPIIESATANLILPNGTKVQLNGTALGAWQTINGDLPFGVKVDWFEVLNQFGAGIYQIELDGGVQKFYSFKYDLQIWEAQRADQTVRLFYTHNNQIGDYLDSENIRDFNSSNWEQQLRLPFSRFGEDTSEPTDEYVRYQNGYREWTQKERLSNYKLKISRADNLLMRYLQFETFMSNFVEVTDYNQFNPMLHLSTKVNEFGAFEPDFSDPLNNYPSVTIDCKAAINNHLKFRN